MSENDTSQWVLHPDRYQSVRLPRDVSFKQPHVELEQFVSVTYSPDDIVVICPEGSVVEGATQLSDGWRVLQIKSAYSLDNSKQVADVSHLLREASVKIQVASAFDTDYLLIDHSDIDKARESLGGGGYKVEDKQLLSA